MKRLVQRLGQRPLRRTGIIVALALCALPAHGEKQLALAPTVVHALTPIDSIPTKQELVDAFENQDALLQLAQIAQDPAADFGIRLRAIRALPHFCPTGSCDGALAHDTLVAIIQSIPANDHTGQTVLRLRAAIEALGVAKSGDPLDVPLLVPLLEHASRDIRAATVRALGDMCNTQAISHLFARRDHEPTSQVLLAITEAVRDLHQCSQ